MLTELNPSQDRFFTAIWKAEAFKYEPRRLKLHEKFPDAPLSPYYVSFREEDVLPGSFFDLIQSMVPGMIDLTKPDLYDIEYLIGIPKAGDPIAREFLRQTEELGFNLKRLTLQKDDSLSKRRVTSVINEPYEEGVEILGIDDVITGADTKLEFAEAVIENGLKIRRIVVGLDREEGGVERLRKDGVEISAVLGVSKFLIVSLQRGKLTQIQYDTIENYRANPLGL